ncbi:uncharacterized protein N7496_007414 [Penicillium cataractarum]|uniref:Uncharacterized protein n=1 Tax=Penicillium cataractarum TaxID=2100454 RepID=A0A9W9V783_9EURO|nr:uncharacterized protein N7496_007414 [Penicillium cataractarum]KAJ5371322.1 hypothetical protein N7496_007414 [Penicillium cataractarum]
MSLQDAMDIDEPKQQSPVSGNSPRVVLLQRPMALGHAQHAPTGLPQPVPLGLPRSPAVPLPARPPLPGEEQREIGERLAELEARRQAAIEEIIRHRAAVAATAAEVEWYDRRIRGLRPSRGTRQGRSRSRSPPAVERLKPGSGG